MCRVALALFLTLLLFSCSQKDTHQQQPGRSPIAAVGIVPRQDTLKPPVVRLLDTCVAPLIVSTSAKSGKYNYYNDTFHLAQAISKPAGFRARITTYNADDGLFSNISCMYQDRSGHMWFGTESGGSIRYDGATFTTYTKAQGLSNNRILTINEDRQDNICFGTMGGGVSVYNGVQFTTHNTSEFKITNFDNNGVSSMLVDSSGNTWYGTFGGGVSCYNGKGYEVYTDMQGLGWVCNGDCLGANLVFDMLEDKRGSVWFCLGGGGASHFDGHKFTNYSKEQGLGDNIVRCAIKDKHGNIWFGTGGGGASCFNGQSFTTYTTVNGLANNNVADILEDDRGYLWFATDGGVSRYDGHSFTTINTENGLGDNRVSSIVQDKSGSIWFGTLGGGASRYDRNAFTTFTTREGLTNNRITTIGEDTAGVMWFGTAGSGIIRYDGISFTPFDVRQGLPFGFIEKLKVDRNNNLWVGTGGVGVTRFDGKTCTTYDDAQLLNNRTVYSILEDGRGAQWFTTYNGVTRLEGNVSTNYNVAQGLCHPYIISAAKDKNGNMWFGSNGGGVSRFDGRVFTNYTTKQGLPSNVVPCILSDSSGNVWFGSDGVGVTRYDGKTFFTFTMADGFANNYVTALVEDQDRTIWMGTNEGFSGITGLRKNGGGVLGKEVVPVDADISNDAICKGYAPVVETYNFKNGYPVRNVKAKAMYADSKGVIWAGAGDMLVRFDRTGIYRDTSPLKVFIKDVKINGGSVSWHTLQVKNGRYATYDSLAAINEEVTTYGSALSAAAKDTMRKQFGGVTFDSLGRFYAIPYKLVLPYKHNKITIDFAAIHLSRSYLVQYQYILDGYDEEWGPLTHKTSASFGNIPEGKYTFKVKALSPEGVWSVPMEYSFEILPPFYRTWWAYCVYALLAALAIYCLLRWRTVQLTKDKEQLEQVVVERTAEVVKEKTEVEKQKKVADKLLVQKDILMKEIHHRVKNNLQVISTLLDLQLDNINDLVARKAISEGMGRIKSISLIHQQLYQGDEMAGIELPRFTDELMRQVTMLFKKPGQEIVLTHDVTNKMLDIDTAVPLGLIMNELMTNSYKYAFGDGGKGSINIHVSELDGNYTLTYRDSGPGLPAGFDMSRSATLGQVVMSSLSKQLGGSFNYNEATKEFVVTFKDITQRKMIV
ncbi:two-component regulator propeller domain-containing protein [Flavipsychrobacter stenotrophus]|uniref:two-component regulator propeller domain-containing protein n=1 Tax=Flavipsychrobacter stenotrophus TaxID=2077091 RepID=UPI0013752A10|nr:two-component regulator propeller domain-containing protein [Flavipsychrobacter stenotrophus]